MEHRQDTGTRMVLAHATAFILVLAAIAGLTAVLAGAQKLLGLFGG